MNEEGGWKKEESNQTDDLRELLSNSPASDTSGGGRRQIKLRNQSLHPCHTAPAHEVAWCGARHGGGGGAVDKHNGSCLSMYFDNEQHTSTYRTQIEMVM